MINFIIDILIISIGITILVLTVFLFIWGKNKQSTEKKYSQVFTFATLNIETTNGETSDQWATWNERKSSLFAALKEVNSDIIGLQEVTHIQKQELLDQFKHTYTFIGDNRQGNDPESNILLIRTALFDIQEHQTVHFDLEDYPQYGNGVYHRTCVWAKLKVKHSQERLFVLNTHAPRRVNVKNQQVVFAQLNSIITRERGDACTILLGDWNPGEPHLGGFEMDKQLAISQDLQVTNAVNSGTNGTRPNNAHLYYRTTANGEGLDVGRKFDSFIIPKNLPWSYSTIYRYLRSFRNNGGHSNKLYAISDHELIVLWVQI
jgi:endonuclease/exonuclease/phosphatase family metal-dependent hydrolase